MEILAALALIRQLAVGIRNAVAAGKTTVSENDIDLAVLEIDKNDADLTAAIERAQARTLDPGP